MSGTLPEGAAAARSRGSVPAPGGARAAPGVSRRDFLRLRARGTERVLELSCEALYMRYVEAGVAVVESDDAHGGEPPTAIAVPTKADLLDDLSRRLADADRLEVRGAEWLVGDFGREVRVRLDASRVRGGKVT